ncbi:MAG TPA: fumarylacetoacetate hydrolase family protein [Solirubrobacteraceae bacterium]|jgi:2-keto-4-pentenoate hydratase/2-oxohepta-3-ene-1,7-dioic acid hydratase in catechol pathway|nr:fumarylacetoacetate hydrolase family protein [Solirubrobacteraceae bacterium]
MRLARYEHAGTEHLGIVQGGAVRALPAGTEILELLADPQARERAAAAADEPVALGDVRLRAPLTPTTLRDFVCFEAHVEGMVKNESPDAVVPADWYEAPTFYFSSTTAIFGHGDSVEVPPGCQLLDLELEVGIVIGKEGRDIPVERAGEHIAGFTIYNDFSARDLGAREKRMGLGWAKAKDFANALGPWIVTVDEWEQYRQGDRYDMELVASRNGEPLGRDTLANIAWSFAEMIAYASRGAWVRTGDVLGSGTCASGCLGELWGRNGRLEPRPLAAGDEVTLSVEGIGQLTNRIVAGAEPLPVPKAHRRTEVGA